MVKDSAAGDKGMLAAWGNLAWLVGGWPRGMSRSPKNLGRLQESRT